MERRQFLEAAAMATASFPISTNSGSEPTDEGEETPDLSNPYPHTQRLKGGTGHAISGIRHPQRFSCLTKGETEDFGGVTDLELYQHALQWGSGISLKIRKGDIETAISLDVDRAELLGHWLIEAARDTKRWRAENPEAWRYQMKKRRNVATRIDDPVVDDAALGTDRLKSPSELAAVLTEEVTDAD
ncbi:hypothetical protein ELS19_17530 [Halogeometricum borinquense]|uniref:Uncharacterized protein n=1 Tax=Halogeometricum borinquense TaxID=60847 RepID=A0A482TBE4_9EURY|nr:hypothetical protein [Halogeometricum borinquense]RYJ08353.1 hypothetical protein ELS19_17530 [Halogeometricum borinquense]